MGTVHVVDKAPGEDNTDWYVYALDTATASVTASILRPDGVVAYLTPIYGVDDQIYFVDTTSEGGSDTYFNQYDTAVWNSVDQGLTTWRTGPPKSGLVRRDPTHPYSDYLGDVSTVGITAAGLFLMGREGGTPPGLPALPFGQEYVYVLKFPSLYSTDYTQSWYPTDAGNEPYGAASDGQYLYATWPQRYDTFTGVSEPLLTTDVAKQIYSPVKRQKDGAVYVHTMSGSYWPPSAPAEHGVGRIKDGVLEELYNESTTQPTSTEWETMAATGYDSGVIVEPYYFFLHISGIKYQSTYYYMRNIAVARYNMVTNMLDRKWYVSNMTNLNPTYMDLVGQGAFDQPNLQGGPGPTARWFH